MRYTHTHILWCSISYFFQAALVYIKELFSGWCIDINNSCIPLVTASQVVCLRLWVGVKIWTQEWWFPNCYMLVTVCYHKLLQVKVYDAPVQVSPRLKTWLRISIPDPTVRVVIYLMTISIATDAVFSHIPTFLEVVLRGDQAALMYFNVYFWCFVIYD